MKEWLEKNDHRGLYFITLEVNGDNDPVVSVKLDLITKPELDDMIEKCKELDLTFYITSTYDYQYYKIIIFSL